MKADHGLSPALLARWCVCALALALVSLNTLAARSGDFGKNAISQNGKTTTIYPMGAINSGGSTIPVTPTVGGWTGAGNYGFPPQATGPTAGVNYRGQFADGGSPTGQAMKYPYNATSTVPWGDVAKAVGTMGCSLVTGGAAALACAVAVPLVIDWIGKGGGRLNPQTGALERKDPTLCTVAPCYQFKAGPMTESEWVTGLGPACQAWIVKAVATYGWNLAYRGIGTIDNGYCLYSENGQDRTTIMQRRSTAPVSATWIPASMDDIAPYMGTPADGRVIGELLDKGADIPLSVPTITGPTSITGPVTTTINNDGSRTVTSTTNNYTTGGNTVTSTSSVTTTTTYNTDNSVRNTTTTTTVPTAEAEKQDVCKDHPESLMCVELGTPEGTIPKSSKNITYSAESVWGGGSCPQDKQWMSQTMARSYTLIPWSTACGWAVSMRAVVLLLAAWAAFWIVMPGNTQVKPQ